MIIRFLWSVTCFISVIECIDLSVSASSVSSGSVIFSISCHFRCTILHAFGKCSFFLQSWLIDSWTGFLWLRLQIGSSQHLQYRCFGLSSGVVPHFCVFVILRLRSFSISFSLIDKRASGMVYFLFFLSYVICCICSTTFSTSKSFSFGSWSRLFSSVIDVLYLNIGNLVLISRKSQSFSESMIYSQWSSGDSVSVCFVQKNLHVNCICLFLVNNICSIFW